MKFATITMPEGSITLDAEEDSAKRL